MDRAAMLALLTADEGMRLDLYDDKTSKTIKPGSVVEGHPTIGVGRALDVFPLTREEGQLYTLQTHIY